MALTNTALQNAKPADKPYKLYDELGLFIQITPAGGKWWRFKYRIDNKEKLLSLGTYPEVSLKAARTKRDEARELVAAGTDPTRLIGFLCMQPQSGDKYSGLPASNFSNASILCRWVVVIA